ncbi:unnamed protein product [Menidia menidia]|uniref:(Atlantic silverside) hypothetical protein n=1 Tax=Menidia menidia TaxID=238744 RepID=A0A8S4ASN7_9TELE|nr:unnamed protein product [Menidia menidia]
MADLTGDQTARWNYVDYDYKCYTLRGAALSLQFLVLLVQSEEVRSRVEERGGDVGRSGGQWRGVAAARGRGEGVQARPRLEEGLGEEAGQGREDAADRWDGGRGARGVRVRVQVRVDLQAGQLQGRRPDPVPPTVRESVHPAGLQVLLLERVEAEVLALEALPAPQEAPVLEHVGRVGVQRPVVALPGVAGLPGHLHEAVVERQVVPDRVLPRRELLPVVGEALADEVADLAERQTLFGALQDGHGYQSDVGVRGLDGRGAFGFPRRWAAGVPVLAPRAGSLRGELLLAVFDSFPHHVDDDILHGGVSRAQCHSLDVPGLSQDHLETGGRQLFVSRAMSGTFYARPISVRGKKVANPGPVQTLVPPRNDLTPRTGKCRRTRARFRRNGDPRATAREA